MKSMLSALQLDSYVTDWVEVQANQDYDPDSERTDEICPEIEIKIHDAGENTALVSINVKISKQQDASVPWESVPYTIGILMAGRFCLPEDIEANKAGLLVNMAAPAILYGMARAEIASITGRGRYGEFLLPCIDLSAMAEKVAEEHEEHEKA